MNLLTTIITASLSAGKAILDVYHSDFDVEYKEDRSPLTLADRKAHTIIAGYLEKTGIPVLSEEGRNIPYEERKKWNKMWVVDPLDGTKEFVKRNGEFTVNIALVEKGVPVMGVVYAPVLDEIYIGEKAKGAFKLENASKANMQTALTPENKLPLAKFHNKDFVGVVASRSHLNDETKEFIDKIKLQYKKVELVSKGSSLKLCMVAEGVADIYPRFAPTMEWDTAAGDAVVRASGGKVTDMKTNNDLRYNKENLLNPWFVVTHKNVPSSKLALNLKL